MRIKKSKRIVFIALLLSLILASKVNSGDVILSWDANSEQDLKGYKVYYGNSSGYYNKSINVGNVSAYRISELYEEVRYYFVVTAYDTAGNESVYSEEVQAFLIGEDKIAPEISQLVVLDENQIQMIFSEAIEKGSAENKANYQINNGIIVEKALLANDGLTVTIQTSSHLPGEYIIVVNNIKDQAPNPNFIESNSSITYQVFDDNPPYIINVQTLSENQVLINFSEQIEIASAENLSNYAIGSGINISKAELLIGNDMVRLTTTAHQEKLYTLIVSNIKDRAAPPNTIITQSSFKYEYVDKTAPTIVNVQAHVDTMIEVIFSEDLEKESSENITNFAINNGILVKQAVLKADLKTVFLLTSPHHENRYTITIHNIKDKAKTPNKISYNSTFGYEYVDTTAPKIVDVVLEGEDRLKIEFSEPVEEQSAEIIVNYNISGGIEVTQAELDDNLKTVFLTTTRHTDGNYTIVVNSVKDLAAVPNLIKNNSSVQYTYIDKIPPDLINVRAITDVQLEIVFSEQVEKTSAENLSNYSINNNIQISHAILESNNKVVHLTTSKHGEGIYSITVNNIKDRAAVPNTITSGTTFDYQLIDLIPPEILNAVSIDENKVDIVFNEPVEKSSAETISNYTINNGINVNQAILENNLKVVHLTTSTHPEGNYVLAVSNVKDRADNPNLILPLSQINYEYIDQTPPEIIGVTAFVEDKVEITFSELLDEASAVNKLNYFINNNITIIRAELNENGHTVFLYTNPHFEVTYQLTVNNIKDRAGIANSILENSKAEYKYIDTTAPAILSVVPEDVGRLKIEYSEPVEKFSAEMITNYDVSDGVQILQAILENDTKTVLLSTTHHTEEIYTVTVNNVNDRAAIPNIIKQNSSVQYEYIDNIPPELINVQAITDTVLDIVFSEPIESSGAEDLSNYSIDNGVVIYQALLDNNKKVVHLSTSKHGEGIYTITIQNIKDRAANPNFIRNSTSYQYQLIDTLPPEILNAVAVNENKVDITFNESVEKSSAEILSNYTINNGISISQVNLDDNLKVAHLTTSNHLEGGYVLTVSNVKDRADNANVIVPQSQINYEYIDQTPPEIIAAKSIYEDHIEITFSKLLDKESAENESNYKVNNNITIFQADLDENGTVVSLLTSPHVEGTYLLIAKNIKDRAAIPNSILENSTVEYNYVDTTAPTILSIMSEDEDKLKIEFSEPVEKFSAETISNYSVGDSIQILQAVLENDTKTVLLTTTRHKEGIFTIVINNIKDQAAVPNTIASNSAIQYEYIDTIPPELLNVQAITDTQLYLVFSEQIEKAQAENISNYSINNGIDISQAILDNNQKVVRLITSIHGEEVFKITVNNIRDLATTPNTIKNGTTFDYQRIDTIPPEIVYVGAVDENRVEITFSEPIEKTSAETVLNYEINNGISVNQAILQNNFKIVTLVTSKHSEGSFVLSVNGIMDRANSPNKISNNSTVNYDYVDAIAPEIENVQALSDTHVVVHFSEPVDKQSAENVSNYAINNGVIIHKVVLDENFTTALLTTSFHTEGSYSLLCSNIKDKAASPNTIINDNPFQYSYVDRTPPVITSVRAIAEDSLEIKFSEKVIKQSAENILNYKINGGIEVKTAVAVESQHTIYLATSKHNEGTYLLTINGILDRASSPNMINENSTFEYLYVDTTEPSVLSVETITEDLVVVTFNEPVEKSSAEKISNYSINRAVMVSQATLDVSLKKVYLITSAHSNGVYTLTVNGIKDRAENVNQIQSPAIFQYQYIDTIPPEVSGVLLVSEYQFDVTFSEQVDRESTEDLANYVVSTGMIISQAKLDQNLVTVHLTIVLQAEGTFVLTIKNIKDRATPPNIMTNGTSLEFQYFDIVPPSVLNVVAPEENRIDIEFTEHVEKTSAENLNNYQINNNIEITSVILDPTGKVAHLTTTNHLAGSYIILIENITDIAQNPNAIEANSIFTYNYVDEQAPEMVGVNVLDANNLKVMFDEKIDKSSAENPDNFKIRSGGGLYGINEKNLFIKSKEIKQGINKRNFQTELTSSPVDIVSLNLASDEKTVNIQTTTHEPGKYLIIAGRVKDKATNPNEIFGEQQLAYEFLDVTSPFVSEVVLTNKTHIDVIFSEPLARESAENENNYQINNGIQVLTAQLDSSLIVVHLITNPHEEGTTYNLTMNNISDLSPTPNIIEPNTINQYVCINQQPEPPLPVTLNPVTVGPDGTVILNWETSTENNISGYKIYYGQETRSYSVIIDAGNVLTYSVSGLTVGQLYYFALTTYDNYQQESDFSNEQEAVTQMIDLIPPTIDSVRAVSNTEVVVVYSENVDKVSSENSNNYSINNGIEVYSATQDTSQQIVRLITSIHSPGEYEIVLNNIGDLASSPNIIESETIVAYQFYPDDFSAPKITELKVINRNHIDIWFNEYLDKRSSETKENYFINNNVTIYQSRLSSNNHVVHLTTSNHISTTNYSLTINGISDCASPPNHIEPNTKLNYWFVENDTIAPEIYTVLVKSDTTLDVYFTEMVQLQQALNIDNYQISNGIQILHARTKNDNKTVELQTTPHQQEVVYLVSVSGIRDFASPPNININSNTVSYAYRPDDVTAPEILAIETTDDSHVNVKFSEMIDKFEAELEYNYSININVTIFEAKINHPLNVVQLTTSTLTTGEIYTLFVNNVKDIAINPNVISPNSTREFFYILTDEVAPMIINCYLEDEISVVVDFNEEVEMGSAEIVENYKIDQGINIYHALLDSNLKTVRLITSEHQKNINYTMKIKEIKDRAVPSNNINQNLRVIYSSQTSQEPIIQNLNRNSYQLGYLKVGDEYYVDQNFIITKIPLELSDCLWIKTASDDVFEKNEDFLNFKLSEKATIYVAFDSRALNYPEWLVSNCFRIGKSINVSGGVECLDVWAMETEPGLINLGGNLAQGGDNIQAMYAVIIKGENQNNMMIQNGMDDPDSKSPNMNYVLFQNYPNPFNEGTKIKFQLRKDANVEIQIFNIHGQTLKTLVQEHLTAGNHLILWNGKNKYGDRAPSGIYFTRMVVKRKEKVDGMILDRVVYTKVRKMLFVK
jgi:hypothetical protein